MLNPARGVPTPRCARTFVGERPEDRRLAVQPPAPRAGPHRPDTRPSSRDARSL